MNSETSTDHGARGTRGADARPGGDLPPWQFFLIGGMLAATAVVVLATGQTLANIIILSLTILSVSFVALGVLKTLGPLVLPESATAPRLVAGRTRAALEREKTLVLRAIKELEFDFSMGKVSQVDFDQMGGRLRARAIGLIQQLDRGEYKAQIERELNERLGPAATGSSESPVESGFSQTPAAVRLKPDTTERVRLKPDTTERVRLKPDTTERVRLKPDTTERVRLKPDTTERVRLKPDNTEEVRLKTDTTCPSCQTENDADARFCKQCGTRLQS